MEKTEVKTIQLTKEFINQALPCSIDVVNTKEAYDNYFMLGGTVRKMSSKTVINYQKYKLMKLKNQSQ